MKSAMFRSRSEILERDNELRERRLMALRAVSAAKRQGLVAETVDKLMTQAKRVWRTTK